MITRVTQVDVGHGDHTIIEVEHQNKLKYILADLGDEDHGLAEFKKTIQEQEKPVHLSVLFTHMHKDHIGCFNELLKMHEEGIINIDNVCMSSSIIKSSNLIDMLKNGNLDVEKVLIDPNQNSRQDYVNILGYICLYYGEKSEEFKIALNEFNTKIQNGNKKQIKETDVIEKSNEFKQKIIENELLYTKNDYKEDKNKIQEYLTTKGRKSTKLIKEYNDAVKRIKIYETEQKEVDVKVKKLFQNMNKVLKLSIPIRDDKNMVFYGAHVDAIPFEKDLFRNQVKQLNDEGRLLAEIGYDKSRIADIIDASQYQQMDYYLKNFCDYKKAEAHEEDGIMPSNYVAYLLINKAYKAEQNQDNTAYMVHDANIKYLCTGDMEIPQEIQVMLSSLSLDNDVSKLAHHYSFTSNSPYMMQRIIRACLCCFFKLSGWYKISNQQW